MSAKSAQQEELEAHLQLFRRFRQTKPGYPDTQVVIGDAIQIKEA